MNLRGLQISTGIFRCVLLGLLAVALTATAQEFTLPVYQLTIAPDDLEALLQNPFTNSRKPAILTSDSMDYPCEVRFRGATCRDLPKKSWKVFFEGDGPLGWDETNLNAEYRDKSLMRNALCMDLARALELPAPDFRYISLLVNGEYWGVHHEIESIDEDFFERRELELETLFKSVSHACRFAPVLEPERLTEYYEPQRAPQGSIDTLAARFVFFQNAARNSIEEHAEALVDVDNVMRYFAIQYAINNQDGFTKNYYLAEDRARLYRLFPWDCDATLGNDWRGDFVYDPFNLDMGLLVVQTLFQRLIAVEDYSDLYYALLDETISGGFDTIAVRAQQYHDLIQHDVYLDTMKRGTNEEFETALTDILGYLSGRREALSEISHVERFDVEDYSRTTDHIDAADDPVFLSARISGDPLFVYSILMQNAEENFWFLLEDDGLHGDSVAGDHIYSRMVTLPDGVPPYYYTFRITPQNRLGVSYWPPAGDFAFWSTPLHVPVIGLSISQPEANSIEIESAVQTSDHETHALVLRNVSDRSIQLGGYVVRLGSSVRMGRIGREAPLRPGQAMIFSNHPEIMRSYNPWDIVAGGFYFPVQPGDTVSLETPSGDRVISRSIEGVFVLEDQVGEVVINEINYHSADNFDPGDWIELHAPGAAV
ncbi:CotH kinase family protein, partial [bacterium]|nr:CotH kinase family protein [bacterium]